MLCRPSGIGGGIAARWIWALPSAEAVQIWPLSKWITLGIWADPQFAMTVETCLLQLFATATG
jgi:hypothetical protein